MSGSEADPSPSPGPVGSGPLASPSGAPFPEEIKGHTQSKEAATPGGASFHRVLPGTRGVPPGLI